MEIDRKAVDQLASMSDGQLKMMMRTLAARSGIDPSEFNIDLGDITSIRHALATVSDDDLNRIAKMYEENRRGGKGR